MEQGLKDYLDSCKKANIDEKILTNLRQAMVDAVPKIIKRVQERERVAAEMRYKILLPSRPVKEPED